MDKLRYGKVWKREDLREGTRKGMNGMASKIGMGSISEGY
jgi:hypothetical protein